MRTDVTDTTSLPAGGIKKLLLLALFGGTFLTLVLYANAWKEDRRVRQVVIEGQRIVDTREILALADVPLQARMFELDLSMIARRLQKHKYVRAVAVHRDLPDRIRIVIQEREPVAVLARGTLFYVDAEGYVLPYVRSEHIFDLPVLSVSLKSEECVPGRKIQNDNVHRSLSLLSLAQQVDPELYRNISEIGGDTAKGFVLYTAERGIPVLLGNLRFGEKLVMLSAFWKTIVASNGADRLQYIDVRFADQVVVRWNHHRTDVSS
ncbi:MAG TPA: FtsQ-type POTRA domain-containing protein [Bacteroidota bacterium]|nr:FtsQ-type POTRA domain-containing protein [Bacteroidota bacterium]